MTQLSLIETPIVTQPAWERPIVRFNVFGKAEPQGSLKSWTHPTAKLPSGAPLIVTTSDNAKLLPWRQQVAMTALEERRRLHLEPFGKDTPVAITLRFYFTRPKSVKPSKRPGMTTKPDGDKLLRAVLDALTSVLFVDDAQVVEFHVRKFYIDEPRHPGPERCEFKVSEAIL